MSLFVVNIESVNGTNVLGAYNNEKLAKVAVGEYVESNTSETLKFNKKQNKKEDTRKVLYTAKDVVITLNVVPYETTEETKKKKEKVKKGPSAYIVFGSENRTKIKEANPDASFGEIGKLVGAAWTKLTESEKSVYKTKAESLKPEVKTE